MPVPSAESHGEHVVHHPWFARFYARTSVLVDTHGSVGANRDELLAGLSGRVVEIGAGNGLNFARYPRTVSEVVAVEPEPHMRRLAAEAAQAASVPVDVVSGTAEELPLESGVFDAAVCSLMLCSLEQEEQALAELLRVLRPGGRLRFYEHSRAEGRAGMERVQRALDASVWPRLFGGCHTARDPVGRIGEAGFEDLAFRRLLVRVGGLALPHSFHVLGSARRP